MHFINIWRDSPRIKSPTLGRTTYTALCSTYIERQKWSEYFLRVNLGRNEMRSNYVPTSEPLKLQHHGAAIMILNQYIVIIIISTFPVTDAASQTGWMKSPSVTFQTTSQSSTENTASKNGTPVVQTHIQWRRIRTSLYCNCGLPLNAWLVRRGT